MVFPTERPATELGNKVALHKTLHYVSLESHQLISCVSLKNIKAVLAVQGLKEKNFVLTLDGRQDKIQ
ncbi:TPA: hypothetical protein JAZ42_02605 [Legionella pneumophila]|nr:hypothetical protein [Legionella pneumophila]HAT7767936.1 hypothetical protein [Legionella pneumophila]HAU1684648.1 hypothetical protein [Legionella pneumophila]HAU1718212.1 hypothetical protein [Legionella pneumophila]HAU1900778.1 hypothetical protein [Legionella pneumophila]